jgi:large subunit ribosomal protein L28
METVKLNTRKALSGNKRSHALNATKRKWNINKQKITVTREDGSKVLVIGSAKDIKTLRKNNFADLN